jgi:hypothetical protein
MKLFCLAENVELKLSEISQSHKDKYCGIWRTEERYGTKRRTKKVVEGEGRIVLKKEKG